jgi:phage head maturation protease
MMKAVGILSTSAPVKGIIINPRGVEIGPDIPILDSHNIANGALGYLERAWVGEDDDDAPALYGELIFTGRAGRRVHKLIERGSLSGVSCRFETVSFEIFDANGNELSADEAVERGHDDPDLIVIAQRSILQEVSITSVPADPGAFVRALGLDAEMWRAIRHGEAELQRILHSDQDGVFGNMQRRDGFRRIEMPPLIQYGSPEPILR